MRRSLQNLVFISLVSGLLVTILAQQAPASGPILTGMLVQEPSADAKDCAECHAEETPGIVSHWEGSSHATFDVNCIDCHSANEGEADAWMHEGSLIATIVTPRDCRECHEYETDEFLASHHAKAGRILHSLDNRLAEVAEGNREPYNPHGITPGREDFGMVNGLASAQSGCWQCHGSKIAFDGIDGIDGSCTACHSRHDFSPRRARQPENCGKRHLGPDHPQKEVYEESKHGIAYRDMKDEMNLDSVDSVEWVLDVDYNAALTCATCHMSGNKRNGGGQTFEFDK